MPAPLSPQTRIGFIGMGLMGIPMSLRLLEAGFDLRVWNRTPDKCRALEQAGARVCETAGQLVDEVEIICICISDTAAVEALLFGDGKQTSGIAKQLRAAQVIVDFSSIDPETTRQMAARVEQSSGSQWLDTPVSGGVAGAQTGQLAIMAGGDTDTLARLQTLFAPLSQRVTHMGPVGSGQATKVCNQMLVSCNLLAMAEVLVLAERSGVDASKIPAALKGGFADSIPLQLTGQRMADRDLDEVKWHIKTLLKDLDLAAQLSGKSGAQTPLTSLVQKMMQEHAEAGFLNADPATLIKRYADQ